MARDAPPPPLPPDISTAQLLSRSHPQNETPWSPSAREGLKAPLLNHQFFCWLLTQLAARKAPLRPWMKEVLCRVSHKCPYSLSLHTSMTGSSSPLGALFSTTEHSFCYQSYLKSSQPPFLSLPYRHPLAPSEPQRPTAEMCTWRVAAPLPGGTVVPRSLSVNHLTTTLVGGGGEYPHCIEEGHLQASSWGRVFAVSAAPLSSTLHPLVQGPRDPGLAHEHSFSQAPVMS